MRKSTASYGAREGEQEEYDGRLCAASSRIRLYVTRSGLSITLRQLIMVPLAVGTNPFLTPPFLFPFTPSLWHPFGKDRLGRKQFGQHALYSDFPSSLPPPLALLSSPSGLTDVEPKYTLRVSTWPPTHPTVSLSR